MQNTGILFGFQSDNGTIASRVGRFFANIGLVRHASRCGITKNKGISTKDLLMTIFTLPFLGQNIILGVVRNTSRQFGKDAVYDFLGSSRFSWRRLLLLVAIKAMTVLDVLTSNDREAVLILDDTSIHRPRAKKVELLARLYDHCEKRFLKGFRMLILAWSDGASLVPVDFALLSSADPCNRYQDVTKKLDRRSCGAIRRREAMNKSTAFLAPMV